jgi:ABC-type uncharacterized transport system involved in gliding motility auxiliary subunit
MKQKFGPVSSLVAALVLLLAINVVASIGLRDIKADLTEENLYTLAEGSKKILDKVEDDIKLRFFYSKKAASGIPSIKQYADRVIELLKQYEAAGGDRITLEQLEPRPDTEIEEWALKYGLQPASRVEGEGLYFGLAAVSEIGEEEVIPFLSLQRESFLEYDITRMIAAVGGSAKKTIGILSSLEVAGNMDDPMVRFGRKPPAAPWALVSELKKQYEVVQVDVASKAIDESLDLLMVIHPKGLADGTQYAIDQYILGGGRAVIMVDPFSFYEQTNFANPDPNARFQASFDSDLPKLFKAWGIEMIPGKVAADLDLGTQVRMGREVVKHPTFVTVGAEQHNQEEIVSADMESLLFAHAGVLREIAGEQDGDLTRTRLVQTGPRSGEIEAMVLKFGADPTQLRRELKAGDGALTLAMKLSGKFTTAFPDGKPAAPKPENGAADPADESQDGDAPENHLAASAKETTVVVIADVDMVSDDFSVRKQGFFGQTLVMLINDNLTFLGNVAEVLMGGQELATLRTRGKSDRPFTLVNRIERDADERWKGVEEELLQKEQDTNNRLRELERGKDEENRAVLSKSQLEEIRKFRSELAANKKKLREVRRNLRQDIENLGFRIKFINIVLMPVLVLLAGFVPVFWRSYRGRRGS